MCKLLIIVLLIIINNVSGFKIVPIHILKGQIKNNKQASTLSLNHHKTIKFHFFHYVNGSYTNAVKYTY